MAQAEFTGTARFEVKRRLGAGGMGVVYEAFDREDNCTVALKVLSRVDGPALVRFKREFRALQEVVHPNLVTLEQLFEHDDTWFFTMEMVEGVDFLSYVRGSSLGEQQRAETDVTPSADTLQAERVNLVRSGGPGVGQFDEVRLRSALGQLALGLFAFHGAGQIHRDVKPSNTLVARDGRVVLLDFGLTTRSDQGEQSTELHAVGTAAYMAPEQAASKPLEPSADWYAYGVLLYEALTGQLPFLGSSLEVLMDKQQHRPPPPRARVPSVPPDLDDLCVALLQTEPRDRPTGRDVLKRLGMQPCSSAIPQVSRSHFTQSMPFVGRTDELAALRTAFAQSRTQPTIVVVEGESGLGKSELVRTFTESLRCDMPGTVILAGRCHEREAVAYKAFDGIADALSRYMGRLSPQEATALLPMRASLLPKLFPVLRRVEVISRAPKVPDIADGHELRRRLFDALRELLARLSQRHSLVLVIDDLQWTDADSLLLLQALFFEGEAPNLLLLATMRPVVDEHRKAPLAVVDELPNSSKIELGTLSHDAAYELASLLSPSRGPEQLAAIVDEARGHPLFLQELTREGKTSAPGSTSLNQAMWARVARLPHAAKHLLEIVCVAGGPLRQGVSAVAAEMDYSAYVKAAAVLRIAYFVRTEGMRKDDHIIAYHDRVREVVLAHLDSESTRHHHERLAVSLESSGVAESNPQAIVRHAEAAGDLPRAVEYAKVAGKHAVNAMAFERAAELFGKAITLGMHEGEQLRALLMDRGGALENAGRGREAAEAFLAALSTANVAQAFELRRRAATQFLQTGHIEQGLDLLHEVLAEVGLRLSRSPLRALASFLLLRFRLRIRGLGFREREESQIAPESLAQIDVCKAAMVGLSTADMFRGAEFACRFLLLALRAGEPKRIAHALCMNVAVTGMVGRRARAMIEGARPIVERLGGTGLPALFVTCIGMTDFQDGRFSASRNNLLGGMDAWDLHPGGVWESATAEMLLIWALYSLGELKHASTRWQTALHHARARGDRYTIANLSTGLPNSLWLVADDPDRAHAAVRDTMATWPRDSYHLQHYWELLALTRCELYADKYDAAHSRVEKGWPAFKRSHLLRIPAVFTEALFLRASTAVAFATRSKARDTALLRRAKRIARKIRGGKESPCAPVANLLMACIASVEGQRDRAMKHLELAIPGFAAAEMSLQQAVARYRLGQLSGGKDGAELTASATTWMTGEGVKNPARLVSMLAPGFPTAPKLIPNK